MLLRGLQGLLSLKLRYLGRSKLGLRRYQRVITGRLGRRQKGQLSLGRRQLLLGHGEVSLGHGYRNWTK